MVAASGRRPTHTQTMKSRVAGVGSQEIDRILRDIIYSHLARRENTGSELDMFYGTKYGIDNAIKEAKLSLQALIDKVVNERINHEV